MREVVVGPAVVVGPFTREDPRVDVVGPHGGAETRECPTGNLSSTLEISVVTRVKYCRINVSSTTKYTFTINYSRSRPPPSQPHLSVVSNTYGEPPWDSRPR